MDSFLSLRIGGVGELASADCFGRSVFSIYFYDGVLRQLILDLKVHSQWQGLQRLLAILEAEENLKAHCQQADYIMPVPSSLWSRLRGKHDLAYAIAQRLSLISGIPLIHAPWSSSLRWRKQSLRKRRERILPLTKSDDRVGMESLSLPKLLLVDDIVTTGATLHRLAEKLPHYAIEYLTLASALPAHKSRLRGSQGDHHE